jgi:hypothetical protein
MATLVDYPIKDADGVTVDSQGVTLDNTNMRPTLAIGDPDTAAAIAPVSATHGLLVNLGANNDVTVTGTVATTKATTATLANVNDAASSTTLQASNAARLALIIFNDSTEILYVKYGSSASATSFTHKLFPGESYREDLYTGIVTGIWASDASGAARMTELTA